MGEKEKKPLFVKTGFSFVTSEGTDVSFGPLVAMGGSIQVDSESDTNRYALDFLAMGGSLSVGSEVSFDFATTDMYSDGIVYANPLRNSNPAIDDLTGPCLIYQGQVAPGTGMSGAIMFLSVGLGLAASWIAFSTGVGATLVPAIVISSSHAIVIYWGNLISLPSAGVTGALGYLSVSDARVMKSAFK